MSDGGLLYAFYGDDFTGSTDVLEQLAMAGIGAALFFSPPDAEQLRRLGPLQAVGVAGDSRSRTPQWMTEGLQAIFRDLKNLGAPVLHYKVCSTFDSSPERGNIGRALEIGLDVMAGPYVPIVVGAPHLKRFVYEGLLYAADPMGNVQRIDRHPMSRHPVTPMREPNLRKHLVKQTDLPICNAVEVESESSLGAEVERCVAEGCRAVVMDTVTTGDLKAVGRVLSWEASRALLFAVGSSGLTAALIAAWQQDGLLRTSASARRNVSAAYGEKHPLLVVSGSCSAATERQIRWAVEHGFIGMPLEPGVLLQGTMEQRARVTDGVVKALYAGSDVVLFTATGTPSGAPCGSELGAALGVLLHEVLERVSLRRVLLCGGDTSSHALKPLGLAALTWQAPLQPGAPLCVAHADGRHDGLEVVLKGGQMGTDDFFAVVRDA